MNCYNVAMTQKRVLLVGWLVALSPAIIGLIGDLLVSVGMWPSDDGSGGPALLIFLLIYTVPMGIAGHLYTRWYYKKALDNASQGQNFTAPSPTSLIVIVAVIFLLISLTWID